MSLEQGFLAQEVASSCDQSVLMQVLDATDPAAASDFARAVGLNPDDVLERAAAAEPIGDDWRGRLRGSVAALSSDPLPDDLALRDEYEGDFPVNERLDEIITSTTSGLELLTDIPVPSTSAAWLAAVDQPGVFARCLDAGDLVGAWLSLNSRGWNEFRLIRRGLERPESVAADDDVSAIVEAWSRFPHERFGAY